jgi:antitoxin (DNA-binding transcriptional repressor) of toxin-antitoxin stability system
MKSVNMCEAKSSLSRLVDVVESGAEKEIVIARNGRPAAKLVAITARPATARIGVAKGLFEVPDDIAPTTRMSRAYSARRACRLE